MGGTRVEDLVGDWTVGGTVGGDSTLICWMASC